MSVPVAASQYTVLAVVVAHIFLGGCAHSKGSSSTSSTPSVTGSNVSSADAGRSIFSNSCNDCHTLPTISNYSSSDWTQSIIPSMSSKAGLSSTERQELTDYVLSVLGASS
jgi:hypothetical protein